MFRFSKRCQPLIRIFIKSEGIKSLVLRVWIIRVIRVMRIFRVIRVIRVRLFRVLGLLGLLEFISIETVVMRLNKHNSYF